MHHQRANSLCPQALLTLCSTSFEFCPICPEETFPIIRDFNMLYFPIVLFLWTTISNAQMNTLFTVDATCNGRNLDTILSEAKTLLESAQTGVSALLAAKTFTGGSRNRHYMRNAASMFGTTYYGASTLTGLNSADKSTITMVQSKYYLRVSSTHGSLMGATSEPGKCPKGPLRADRRQHARRQAVGTGKRIHLVLGQRICSHDRRSRYRPQRDARRQDGPRSL